MEALTVPAEMIFERRKVQPSQFPDCLYLKCAQFLFRNFPDSRQAPNWQWQQKRVYFLGWMTKSPSGLRQSEASFAKNLFGATPAEAVRFNSWRICLRIVRATSVAVGKPIL